MLTRVPLLIRIPGGQPNITISHPVNSFDAMATILDLAGIAPNDTLYGLSLLPQLRGLPPVATHPYVYSEGGYTALSNEVEPLDPAQAPTYDDPHNLYYPRGQEELNSPADSSRFIMMRNASVKLVYRPLGVSELYNVTADPRELVNLWGDAAYAGVQATMLSDLLGWLVRTSDVTPLVDDDRGEPSPPPYPYGPWPPTAR